MSENTIHIRYLDIEATCDSPDLAAALIRRLLGTAPPAPVVAAPALEEETKPARKPRAAKASTSSTGEKRSVSGAIREAVRANGAEPDLEGIAREFYPGNPKGVHKVKQNLYALVSKGEIKKVAGGGWKLGKG